MVPRIWLDRLAPFRRIGRRGQRRPPPLGVQRLEPRLACAGVVTATLRGDTLTLVGDDLANAVEIRSDGLGGIEVGDAFTGTQFRHAGRLLPALSLPNVGRLTIRLAGGDDQVRFTRPVDRPPATFSRLDVDLGRGGDLLFARELSVSGRTTVKGGQGDDRLALEESRFFGDLRLEVGDDSDSVSVGRGLLVAGGLTIDGGRGDDEILAGARDRPAVGPALDVEGGLSISTGDGADLVEVLDAGVGRDLRIGAGRHDDIVRCERTAVGGALSIATGHGSDGILLNATTSGDDTTLHTGDHADIVSLAGSIEVGGDLVVDKDAGSLHVATDRLTLKRVTGRMVIDSGAALTAIELVGIVAGRDLRVTTGRGEDTVRIAESSTGGTLEVTTGAGADVVTLDQVQAGLVRVLAQGDDDLVTLEDVGGGRVEADGGRGDGDRLAILPPVVAQVVSSGFEIMG